MLTEIILFVLEIAGTVAFAVSGTVVAIKARFDIFGVLVIGCITAVDGGITRDMLIGATAPKRNFIKKNKLYDNKGEKT